MSGNHPSGPPNTPYGQPGPYGPPPGQGGSEQGYSFGPFAGQQPPAGSGGQGGPGGPYGGGPGGPGGPYGGGPYQPSEPGPPEPPKKRSKLPLILAAAAVALVLIITAVVFAVRQSTRVVGRPPDPAVSTEPAPPSTQPPSDQPTDQPTDPASAPPSSSPSTAPPAQPTGADAVAGYLRAVAAGDADAALRYAARPQRRESTLTNAVLAESRRRAPLTAISVPPVDPDATQIRASYKLGNTPVSTVFDVVKAGNAWRLTKVVNDISVAAVRLKRVPMEVNGARVDSNTIRVLPGSYAFTTGSRFLSYGKRNVITVGSPTALVDGIFTLRGQLTSSGIKKVRTEARERWNRCLDSRSPRPTNCPFRWTNNTYRYIDGAVNWRRSGGDPFDKARFLIDTRHGPAMTMPFTVRISGDCRFRGQRGTCRGTVNGTAAGRLDLTKPSANFDWL